MQFVGLLEGHRDWVTALNVAPSSNQLVSASRDKSVITWDLGKRDGELFGAAEMRYSGHNAAVSSMEVSRQAAYALSGSWDTTLRLWKLNGDRGCDQVFTGHKKDVTAVAMAPSSAMIASGSRDGEIRLWNVRGEMVATMKAADDWVTNLAYAQTKSGAPVLIATAADGSVQIWDAENRVKFEKEHDASVTALAVVGDYTTFVTGSKDGSVLMWSMPECTVAGRLDAQGSVSAISVSCDDVVAIATETNVRVVRFDDVGKFQVAAEIPSPESINPRLGQAWCISLTWSLDGKHLFCGATDGRIYVYAN